MLNMKLAQANALIMALVQQNRVIRENGRRLPVIKVKFRQRSEWVTF